MKANQIEKLRIGKHLNRTQLGKLAGVSPQTIKNAEAGKELRPENARAIADVLEVTVEEMYSAINE